MSEDKDQKEAERLVWVAERNLRIAKMRASGELKQILDNIKYDYCFHCGGWHEVCPIRQCNSCACGCPHQQEGETRCQSWWDALNSPEYEKVQKEVHKHRPGRPTIDCTIEEALKWEDPSELYASFSGASLKVVVERLMWAKVPFELSFGKKISLKLTDEAAWREAIEMEKRCDQARAQRGIKLPPYLFNRVPAKLPPIKVDENE